MEANGYRLKTATLNGMLAAILPLQGRVKMSYANNKFLTEENLRYLWRSSSIRL
jgi:hypothetical protein